MALAPDDVESLPPFPLDTNSANPVDAGIGNYDPSGLDDSSSEAARVAWERSDNELNPMNWADSWRWSILVVISYIEFLTLVTTSLY